MFRFKKLFAAALVLAFLACSFWPVAASAQVGSDTSLWNWTVAADHHRSIVEVSLDGATGTGIIIRVDHDRPVGDGFEGWCLTAYHVVSDDNGRRAIKVKYANGQAAKNCKVLAYDKQADVAIVWVWVPKSIGSIRLATQPAAPGDRLEFAGLGGGSQLDCCLRHFSSEAAHPTDQDWIFANVALLPGDSGGPVFNARQAVVGITSGGWFWWDGGVKNEEGSKIRATWPARASNLNSIQQVVESARVASH